MMDIENNFDDIRSYNDDEVNSTLKELIADPQFDSVLEYIFKDQNMIAKVKQDLSKVDNVYDLQINFMYPLIKDILGKSTDGITCSGLENVDKNKSYLFISNHRDIILDSAFMNMLMHSQGLNTTDIAIGNNLLIFEWIEKLVRLNRAFLVKRNLPGKQMLEASKKLSQYIRLNVSEKEESVWIAQREGRSKDGNDQTQVALLKMLNMSNTKSFEEGFGELSLVPLSISYEIEPCGSEKVYELMSREDNPDFQKTPKDDLVAMAEGLSNEKGRVNFAFGKPIDINHTSIATAKNNNKKLAALAELVDESIYTSYKLWPNNYIAYDLLNSTDKYAQKAYYTADQKEAFTALTASRLSKMEAMKERAEKLWLQMYANPVVNFEKCGE
ncbi:glycerol acyltransferase [Puteibacter caeruleilacunae]|nr:glycerol acyltransferase [Puteibacter caeruleilacunae]